MLDGSPGLPLGTCSSLDAFGLCTLSMKLLERLSRLSTDILLLSAPNCVRCGKTLTRGCILRDLATRFRTSFQC